jgi:hypothetical protein
MKEKKECNSCKKQGFNKKELFSIFMGTLILVSSIYGVIHFIKHLMN